MPKLNTPKSPHDLAPVFTWGFKSSRAPLLGGVIFDYATRLNQDGTLSCTCQGWCIAKKDKKTGLARPRRCKHTDSVLGEVAELMQAWRDGKTFTVQEFPTSAPQATVSADTTSTKKLKPKSTPTLKFNRVVEY